MADDKLTMEEITSWTNMKAMLCNAGHGGSCYKHWTPFSVNEMMKHFAVYLLNGLNPSPHVEYKFRSSIDDPVNGSHLINKAIGECALRRHCEFKEFLSACDPRIMTPSKARYPNHKVGSILTHALIVSKEAVIPGEKISCDEQTLGFQGMHSDKQRITYKSEGDGFLTDALCLEGGYTYSFYFCY